MESDKVKNIIHTFFYKDVSNRTLHLFGKWFLMDEDNKEKEVSMKEIWDDTTSIVSEQTLADFKKIRMVINQNSKRSHYVLKKILYQAAFVAIIISCTIYLTHRITPPTSIDYTQLSVSYGESRKIILTDGSIVAINAGSTLIYPKYFIGDTRTVFLTGEANFCVAKDPDKPFIVRTKYINIRALGTKFCVQSYPNAQYTKATLIDGSIKIVTEKDKNKSYVLKPDNQFIYSNVNNKTSIINVDAAKISSWENGYLIFQGATFDEIVQTLERKYNVVINYDGKTLNQQLYYIKFNPDETIEEALDILTILIEKSSYKKNNSTIYFYTK